MKPYEKFLNAMRYISPSELAKQMARLMSESELNRVMNQVFSSTGLNRKLGLAESRLFEDVEENPFRVGDILFNNSYGLAMFVQVVAVTPKSVRCKKIEKEFVGYSGHGHESLVVPIPDSFDVRYPSDEFLARVRHWSRIPSVERRHCGAVERYVLWNGEPVGSHYHDDP